LLISKHRSGILHTEEWKHALSAKNSGEGNPYYGRKHSAKTREQMRVSHTGKRLSESTRILLKRMRNTQDYKNKDSNMVSNLWKKDAYIRKQMQARIHGPNKFEVRALNHINVVYKNKFTYTGDGSFIVNRRSADAYSEELKTVALFNGIYWHLKRYGFKNTEQAKCAIDLI